MEKENPYHKEYGLFSNLWFTLRAMKKYAPLIILMLPLGFVLMPVQRYLWSFLSKYIIDLITVEGSVQSLVKIIIIFTIILIAFYIMQTFYYNKLWVLKIIVRMKIVVQKNYKMMVMRFEDTEDPEVLDCYQKAERACDGGGNGIEGFEQQIISFVENLSVVVGGFTIIGTMNIWLAVIMIVFSIINFVIFNATNKHVKKIVWDQLAPWWRKHWYMNQALANFSYAKDIRMYGLSAWLKKRFTEINDVRLSYQKLSNKIWFWVACALSLLWLFAQGGVYAFLIYKVYLHELAIGNFTLYLTSAMTLFSCMNELLNNVNAMLQRSRECDDLRSFLDLEKEFRGQKDKLPDVPAFDSYEFEFKDVSFKYPRQEKYALRNVSLKIKAGERLAVVGLNGAGKTTFIKLLMRLYEPTEGAIFLNGQDIRSWDLNSYFAIIAPVFQDVNLFAMTYKENVSMKELEKTDDELVKKCTEDAGLGEKIRDLKDGIDTQLLKVIYDDGTDMSGGEKQKLALARALYKNAPVVVLDEPTAALDALAESKLYQDFDKMIGGKTAIYISHRLSSTQFCNNVAMFKDGQLIEYGTHDSLMKKKGEYANMYKVQAQYYVEEGEL
ncbi:MAG: ABC transporter ATP-binding protein [Treponema sp.]|nr:ABC transporter ATP-binding protein [Treponema sp.]MBR5033010.1 ABC transporter ATP-binding protein [Treponema sp.]